MSLTSSGKDRSDITYYRLVIANDREPSAKSRLGLIIVSWRIAAGGGERSRHVRDVPAARHVRVFDSRSIAARATRPEPSLAEVEGFGRDLPSLSFSLDLYDVTGDAYATEGKSEGCRLRVWIHGREKRGP